MRNWPHHVRPNPSETIKKCFYCKGSHPSFNCTVVTNIQERWSTALAITSHPPANQGGGSRTRYFVRDPGFVGTGRGGAKEFRTFSDLNLCGPSTNTSKYFNAGYTTDSGVIKPHLLSFYIFVFSSAADLPALISTDQVKVMPVCEVMDGTALKPGFEFDQRQEKVIRLVNPREPRMFTSKTIPEPKEIKDKHITSADVIYPTTLDNRASIPVGVWYRPKSVGGEEMIQSIQKSAKTIQTCK